MEDDTRELFDFGSDLFALDDVPGFDWPSAVDHVPIKDDAATSALIDAQPTPQDALSSTVSATEKVQRPPIKNRGRERLKQEMEELRQCALRLEQQLQSLHTDSQSQSQSQSQTQSLVRWQSVAETERAKRLRSEQENERLRRTLETQLSLATGLSAYLSSRVASGSNGSGSGSDALADVVTHIPPLFFSSFNFVTAQLLRDVDRAYAMTDALFSRAAWASYPDERVFESTVKTRRYKGEEQLYIELNDTAYRPHSYERVANAVWKATKSVYGSQQEAMDVGVCTDDTFTARYKRSGHTRRGEVKDLIVTSVNKRFVEPDRTVQLWRTCISPALHDSDMPMQALSDETGWVIVTRVPDGFPTRSPGTAFFQATSHLVPLWFEDDVADASVRTQLTIGEFTNVVLSATEADVVSFENMFQRLLRIDDEAAMLLPDDPEPDALEASV